MYESPIFMFSKQICDQMIEDRENAIIAKISEEMAFDINKEELTKALNYDRNQYHKGYIDGEIAGYKQGYDDALEKMQAKLKELIWPEKEE